MEWNATKHILKHLFMFLLLAPRQTWIKIAITSWATRRVGHVHTIIRFGFWHVAMSSLQAVRLVCLEPNQFLFWCYGLHPANSNIGNTPHARHLHHKSPKRIKRNDAYKNMWIVKANSEAPCRYIISAVFLTFRNFKSVVSVSRDQGVLSANAYIPLNDLHNWVCIIISASKRPCMFAWTPWFFPRAYRLADDSDVCVWIRAKVNTHG